MLLVYFGDSTSTNSSLSLDRRVGVARSKRVGIVEIVALEKKSYMIGWGNKVVGTPSYILSETWSHDSTDSLTTNQQS